MMHKLISDIDTFFKIAKEQDSIDLTHIEEFSYSCIVRALRKHLDYKDVVKFIKIFKKEFDNAVINDLEQPDKIALQNAVVIFNDLFPIKFSNVSKNMKTAQYNSIDVTDQEKYQAKQTLLKFKYCIKSLNLALDHLNLIKTPFKENQSADVDSVWKNRSSFRLFRDKAVDNFNDFKLMAFKAINDLHLFSSDMQIIKLIKSFITSVDVLEKKVNEFVDCFDNLKSEDFSKNIVNTITEVESQCGEIENLVDVRIKSYIQENILSSNWIEEVGAKHNLNMGRKQPILIELSEKFQNNGDV